MSTAGGRDWRVPPRPTSSHVAAQYIRELVFEGHLRPGERIPQDAVARALGLSRIPVREAIIALEREGFVTTELHRGAFVSVLDEQAVRDQYELYGKLWGFAAARALERSVGEFISELRAAEKRLAEAEDPVLFAQLDVDFGHVILEAAGSPRVKLVIQAMPGLSPSSFFAIVPEAIAVTKRGNRALLKAFERGDPDRAAACFVTMMCETGELVVELFHRRGLFSTDGDAAGA